MQFKLLALAFTALSGVVHAQDFTANTLVVTIDAIADVSAETNDLANSINFFNPISVITAVPRVILNFKDIAATVASKILMLGNVEMEEDFPQDGQNQICGAFRNFVKIHQNLLNTIIGRTGFLARFGFGAPIAAVLRVLEAGVDKLAFGIIDLVPTCREGALQDKMDLDRTFTLVIDGFS